ncbi:hypothetical protein [Aliihoeflea sp. 40Bstr573]|uniref:hypothetical protein n=1 Tax=Aliihoeflea sp. 40Bstr573 TaxID=2696467 RepID=UPI0020948F1F|nr:hypothetical protein [Aliihoeflea sp. 40Bstr573]MCO6387482.1 hypothetical protein [Aliihoeflea sp. 40Bstr573]
MDFAKIPQPRMDVAERDLALGFLHSLGYVEWRAIFPSLPAEKDLPSAKQARVIDAILSFLAYAAWMHPGRKVSYSRSKDWYAVSRAYLGPDCSYHLVRAAVDVILVCTDAIEDHWIAPSAPGGTGWQSTMTPNPALSAHASLTSVHQPGRALVVRGGIGGFALVPEGEAAKAERMEANVDVWNAIIMSSRIEVALPDDWTRDGSLARSPKGQSINTQAVCLTRIFTDGNFDKGGRYYGGWWQSLPSELRGTSVTIDGGATVELDYSQIHPRMLYVLAGKKLDGDAYTIPGIAREDAKLGWQIVINADTLSSATAALSVKLAASREVVETKTHKAEARKIIMAVKAAHPDISAYFHTGIGVRLQRHDSDVATMVMDTMISKNVVCLPIHDSFIVRAEYRNVLKETMDVAFDRWCRDNRPADVSGDDGTVVPFPGSFSLHTLSGPGLSPSAPLDSDLGDSVFESGFQNRNRDSFPGDLKGAVAIVSGNRGMNLEDTFFPVISHSVPKTPHREVESEYGVPNTPGLSEACQGHGKPIDRTTSFKSSDIPDHDMTASEKPTAVRKIGPPFPPTSTRPTPKSDKAWIPMIKPNRSSPSEAGSGLRGPEATTRERSRENGPLAGENGKVDLAPIATPKRPPVTNRINPHYVKPARAPHPLVPAPWATWNFGTFLADGTVIDPRPKKKNAPPRPF